MGDHAAHGREGLTPDRSGVNRSVRPAPVALWLPGRTLMFARPLVPRDAAKLRAGLRRLSERSRHHRFMTEVNDLSERELRLLTTLDYRDTMAWGVIDWTQGYVRRGVAVGRYAAMKRSLGCAEIALAIVDSHQRRGLGLFLMALLVRSALANGFSRFAGHLLADNTGMMRLLRGLGATFSQAEAGVVQAELELATAARALSARFAGDWRRTRILRLRRGVRGSEQGLGPGTGTGLGQT